MTPRLHCSEGNHEVRVGSQKHRGESRCPEHPDCKLRPLPKKQSTRSAIKATRQYHSALRIFNNIVCSEPCFFSDTTEEGDPRRPGHVCRYPLDGHHLLPKDWLFQHYGDLPLAEFLAILFDPRLGAPLCRTAHDLVEYSSAPDACIYFEELSHRAIEFCEAVEAKYPDRPSPLLRLEVESPPKAGVGA